jgi:putative transposase
VADVKQPRWVPFWDPKRTPQLSKELWYPGKNSCAVVITYTGRYDKMAALAKSEELVLGEDAAFPSFGKFDNSWCTSAVTKNSTPIPKLATLWKDLKDLKASTGLTALDKESVVYKKRVWKKKKEEATKEKEPAGKTRKILLDLSAEQRQVLNGWFGTARWIFNQCVQETNELTQSKQLPTDLMKHLRGKFTTGKNLNKSPDTIWVTKTPAKIRDGALQDFLTAYHVNLQRETSNPKKPLAFRSKKDSSQSIVIPNKEWKDGKLFPTSFAPTKEKKKGEEKKGKKKKEEIVGHERIPSSLVYDTRLQRTKLGKFYVCLLQPLEIRSDKQAPKKGPNGEEKLISLDPGVRTFMTGYDPDGYVFEWGKGDHKEIYRLCDRYSKLQSKWNDKKNFSYHQKRNMKKAGLRIQSRIKNLVRDLHCKLAKWLCENYNVILIPEFQTSKLARRIRRKIDSKTALAMLTWSHYAFRKRLMDKSREFPWVKVKVVTEEYTSQTCGQCGNLHKKLGGNKTFKCPSCKVIADRDGQAARNILLLLWTKKKLTGTDPGVFEA